MTTKKNVTLIVGTLLAFGAGLAYMAKQAPQTPDNPDGPPRPASMVYEGNPANKGYNASLQTIRSLRQESEKEKEMGEEAKREATMRRTIEVAASELGPMHKEVAESLDQLGKFLSDKNRFAEALPYLKRAYVMV